MTLAEISPRVTSAHVLATKPQGQRAPDRCPKALPNDELVTTPREAMPRRPSAPPSPGGFWQPSVVDPRAQRPLSSTRSHLCASSLLRESGDELQISRRENCLRNSEKDILWAEGQRGLREESWAGEARAGRLLGTGDGLVLSFPTTHRRKQRLWSNLLPTGSFSFLPEPLRHLNSQAKSMKRELGSHPRPLLLHSH